MKCEFECLNSFNDVGGCEYISQLTETSFVKLNEKVMLEIDREAKIFFNKLISLIEKNIKDHEETLKEHFKEMLGTQEETNTEEDIQQGQNPNQQQN